MRIPAILTVTLALAACVPAARVRLPEPTRAAPVARPPSRLAADWRDWSLTPGTWRYRAAEFGRSNATYGSTRPGFTLQLTCDARAQRVTLSIIGIPGTPLITIRTSTMARTLPTIAMAHTDAWPPMTSDVRLVPADPLLDAIAFSRGRFVVEQPGAPALVVPAWPEIGRVIEDCRG